VITRILFFDQNNLHRPIAIEASQVLTFMQIWSRLISWHANAFLGAATSVTVQADLLMVVPYRRIEITKFKIVDSELCARYSFEEYANVEALCSAGSASP